MRSSVNFPSVCDVVIEGEVDPEQFLPHLQRVVEVPVACLTVPNKNPVEQL